jgi:hypothetical protein
MEINEIIAVLRREKNLNEADASEQAYAMLATVKSKHPRLEITAVVVDGQTTTLCLKNGTQAKFDPSLPVPIWKYAEGKRSTHPKSLDRSMMSLMDKAIDLEHDAKKASSAQERQQAAEKLAAILNKWKVTSVDELETAVEESIGR